MLEIEHLLILIDNAPKILQYFVPGIVFIMIMRVFCLKKFAANYTIVLSCVISYLFVSLIETTNRLTVNWDSLKEPIVISGIAILLAIISSVVAALMLKSEWFKKFTLKFFHKTIYEDIWQDVFDFKKGTNLKLYMRDKDYYIMGHYRYNEEKGEESWMALSAPSTRDKDTNKIIGISYETKESVITTIRMCDIEKIEIF